MPDIIPSETLINQIFVFRGVKVMIDRNLAELYGVETKVLKQAVRRNIERFPEDFMFELNKQEFEDWRSQFVTSNSDKMGLRYTPMVFTEHGVLMLSSVLNSEKAIQINIQIVRTFTKLREMALSHEDLRKKIKSMENKYDSQFKIVFDAIRELITDELKPKRKIGFETNGKK